MSIILAMGAGIGRLSMFTIWKIVGLAEASCVIPPKTWRVFVARAMIAHTKIESLTRN